MTTNDERREVAARLRNYESLRESFKESPICAFIDALGVGYLDWNGVCNRIADLIEPEQERTTTRNKTRKKYGRDVPVCECCGYSIGDKRYNFCPNCGANVVE